MTLSKKLLGLCAARDILTGRAPKITTLIKNCRLNVDWLAYTRYVENDFVLYNNIVSSLSETGSLEDLDKTIACLSKPLFKSAKTATTNNC